MLCWTARRRDVNVLVTVASKHDSTHEIGAQIGRVLAHRGLDVELMRVEEVVDSMGTTRSS
jgi:menaquinone-dependent protoporphyrinogen IX oxidase